MWLFLPFEVSRVTRSVREREALREMFSCELMIIHHSIGVELIGHSAGLEVTEFKPIGHPNPNLAHVSTFHQ
jgi:hypothetical protein